MISPACIYCFGPYLLAFFLSPAFLAILAYGHLRYIARWLRPSATDRMLQAAIDEENNE